jgi:hypothetical protein
MMDRKIMTLNIKRVLIAALFSLCAGTAAIAFTQEDDMSLLTSLDHGLWQLRAVGGGPSTVATSQLCLGDPVRLTQVQHGDTPCTRFVVRTTPTVLTVSYSCKGQGQGLTTIRKESSKLIQIQSQGIKNNSPFSFSVEGRRAGAC